jgi:hypothetical protein
VTGGVVGLATERELRPEGSGALPACKCRRNGELAHQRVGGRRDASRARCRGITLLDEPVSACDRERPPWRALEGFPREAGNSPILRRCLAPAPQPRPSTRP